MEQGKLIIISAPSGAGKSTIIGRIMQEAAERYHGICGYMGGDNFCLIAPTEAKTRAQGAGGAA